MIDRSRTHRTSRRCLWWRVVCASLLLTFPLQAQRTLGLGEDAVTIPRGTLRVGITADHTTQSVRWNNGRLEGLGAAFTSAEIGPAQLSLLGPLQQLVRDLGVPDFSASLGAPSLDLRQRLFVTPLSVEYGVTDWFTIGVRAPLVRSKAEASFRVRGDSGRATLGLNPLYQGSAVPAANRLTIDRYSAAATNLTLRRSACQSNPGAAPECGTILAELSAVNSLVARTSLFATRLRDIYGAGGLTGGRPYVPMAGSATELALLARVDSLRAAFTRYGITDITAGTGLPLGAQAPLGTADVAALLADSTAGYGARPLTGTAITGFGDLEFGARVKLFDSFGRPSGARFAARRFGLRQTIGVDARLGTGTPDRPDDLIDLGTGTGRTAVTVRSLTDVVLNARLWATVNVGYSHVAPNTKRVRVPSIAGAQLLESWRELDVPVRPGALLDASITPRWQLNDYMALGASLRWRRKSADRHEIDAGVLDPLLAPVPLDGVALDATSGFDVRQFGWHATYSTLAARARGLDGPAFEVSYSHEQAFASGEGIVPKTWLDRVQIRYYTRLFGR